MTKLLLPGWWGLVESAELAKAGGRSGRALGHAGGGEGEGVSQGGPGGAKAWL